MSCLSPSLVLQEVLLHAVVPLKLIPIQTDGQIGGAGKTKQSKESCQKGARYCHYNSHIHITC